MVDLPQLTVGLDGPLQQAHRALLARLAYGFPAKNFTMHTIPANLAQKTWARLLTRTPFVAVGFSQVVANRDRPQLFDGQAEWEIYIGLSQQRPEAVLLGDKLAPGLLGAASVAVALLHGQTDKGLGTWFCTGVQNLYDEKWAEENMGVIGVKAEMRLQVTDEAAAAALPDFTGFVGGLSWDLPEIAAAASPLTVSMGGP